MYQQIVTFFSKVHHHKFDIMAPRANIFDYAQRATSFGLLGLGVSFDVILEKVILDSFLRSFFFFLILFRFGEYG